MRKVSRGVRKEKKGYDEIRECTAKRRKERKKDEKREARHKS